MKNKDHCQPFQIYSNQPLTERLFEMNVRKPCKFYAQGQCKNGNQCKYAHESTSVGNFLTTQPTKKNKPCSYFSAGTCKKGDECPFSHVVKPIKTCLCSKHDGNTVTKDDCPQHGICQHFVRGTCKFGTKCRLQHRARNVYQHQPQKVNIDKRLAYAAFDDENMYFHDDDDM